MTPVPAPDPRRRKFYWLAGAAVLLVALGAVLLRAKGGSDPGDEPAPDVAVHIGTVAREPIHRYVTAYGYVTGAPAIGGRPPAGARLSPAVGGIVTEVRCVEGAHVMKGAVAFRLDDRIARVAAQKARLESDFAQKAWERQQTLWRSNGTSQRALQEAQQQFDAARSNLAAAEAALAQTEIRAPVSGTVARVNAAVGQFVDAGAVLAEIVDLGRLVVAADVASREADALAPGQSVVIGDGADGARGALVAVGREIDPKTGTYRVLASVPAGRGLLPGQFTPIRIQVEEHEGALTVPDAALVVHPGEGEWIVEARNGLALRRPVHAGLREAGRVEVTGEGVMAGMPIVVDEAYSLPDSSRIHPVR